MVDDPTLLSLTEAAAAIRSGRLSAEALATSYLERIARDEARVHAWTWLSPERLLDEARRADASRANGGSAGLLAGVPIAVKDIVDTAGIPTARGSPIFRDHVPTESATCVRLLEQAGAIVQGKTVTTEFANRRPGPTTNPWNATCTPGGSSSGSAAAVAAGFTAAAIGSQTLGSTIRPAAYCGIVGFKPSFGVVSRHGVHPLSRTLDHVGILTRTIEDSALLLSCLAGFDPADVASTPDADEVERSGTVRPLARPPRLAAVRTPYWERAETFQRHNLEAMCAQLRAHGATVDDVDLPVAFKEANEIGARIQAVEAARLYRGLRRTHAAQISEEFLSMCDRGAATPEDAYQSALAARLDMQQLIRPLFDCYDAILTLSATGEAPPTLASTGDPTFCSTWSICGLPAVALPTALGPRRLPIGVQFVGAHRRDQRLLDVAAWCAERLPRILPPSFRANH